MDEGAQSDASGADEPAQEMSERGKEFVEAIVSGHKVQDKQDAAEPGEESTAARRRRPPVKRAQPATAEKEDR